MVYVDYAPIFCDNSKLHALRIFFRSIWKVRLLDMLFPQSFIIRMDDAGQKGGVFCKLIRCVAGYPLHRWRHKDNLFAFSHPILPVMRPVRNDAVLLFTTLEFLTRLFKWTDNTLWDKIKAVKEGCKEQKCSRDKHDKKERFFMLFFIL